VWFGSWLHDEGAEEVVVVRVAPETTEIHCHGGDLAAAQIVAALAQAGCSPMGWRDWLAADPQASDVQREVAAALAATPTLRAAAHLADQFADPLSQELAAIERCQAAGERDRAAAALTALSDRARFARGLTRPWRVALAGWANVGKSSLLNAIVGYRRALVWDLPGVTRDVLAVDVAIEGWPLELVDAAGLGPTRDPLGAAAAERACEALSRADLALWVLDATRLTRRELEVAAETAAAQIAAAADVAPVPLALPAWLAVVNKTDQPCLDGTPAAEVSLGPAAIGASATTGAGVPELLTQLVQRLVPDAPPPGAAIPFTPRQQTLVAEAAARQGR
jgi:tRNA modification GTPase